MYRIQLVNASVSARWYCKFYNTIRQRQRRLQPVQKTPVVLILHVPIPGSRNTSTKVHKGWGFPRGIYSEIHSPIRTLEIICIMALTLQPITGCPQHSGKTGTQLLTAIHRFLFFRFFLRKGGTSVHRLLCACIMLFGYFLDVHSTVTMQNFLMRHLMGDANTWQQLFLFFLKINTHLTNRERLNK